LTEVAAAAAVVAQKLAVKTAGMALSLQGVGSRNRQATGTAWAVEKEQVLVSWSYAELSGEGSANSGEGVRCNIRHEKGNKTNNAAKTSC
jgi:hypothetical protein